MSSSPLLSLSEADHSHQRRPSNKRAICDAWINDSVPFGLLERTMRVSAHSRSGTGRRPNVSFEGRTTSSRENLANHNTLTMCSARKLHRFALVVLVMAGLSGAGHVAAHSVTGTHPAALSVSQGRGGGFVGVFPDSRIAVPRLHLPEIRLPTMRLPEFELPKLQLKVSPQGLCNLLAGGVAGAVASAITCPLEVVKTQLQSRSLSMVGLGPIGVAQKIVADQGIKGLYRGLSPTIVGIIPTRSLYFWSYSASKTALEPAMGDSPVTHMVAAVAAGGLSNTVTCPLWVTKTRMQLEGSNFPTTVRNLFKTQGIGGFYRGLLPSYWGLSEGAIQFLLYEKLKRGMQKQKEDGVGKPGELSTVQYLVAAGASKAVASALTYPHEVVRTRMREAASSRYQGFFQSIALIAKEEGKRGLYGGLGPHLMRVVPNTAIMFLSFEVLSRRLPDLLERKPWEAVQERISHELSSSQLAAKASGMAGGFARALGREREAPQPAMT
eukprot:CAMPEP_0181296580 /NCGR_PEP_ID=MMETSP1101-20121128/4781_1 /TAXON_ID=46948 /ORGANISM="Rhodomonas abbreviata, Strain Caron Lab Isolate" /LENGTH=495 /DNA_ID=CAMNT_0023401457 /DNA_START=46 /DNA_END=1533 /DNA_ORIENTATION=+